MTKPLITLLREKLAYSEPWMDWKDHRDMSDETAAAIDAAREENARLQPTLELLLAVVEAAEECQWINKCRCDKAWTERGRHEPGAICGEMNMLVDALSALREGCGE